MEGEGKGREGKIYMGGREEGKKGGKEKGGREEGICVNGCFLTFTSRHQTEMPT